MSLISDVITGIISPVTTTISTIFTKHEDVSLEKFKVDGQVDLALVQAHTTLIKLNAELLKNAWMVRLQVAFGGPLALYYAKIIVWDNVLHDLTHGFTPALYGDIATFNKWIVGFLFLHSALSDWNRKT